MKTIPYSKNRPPGSDDGKPKREWGGDSGGGGGIGASGGGHGINGASFGMVSTTLSYRFRLTSGPWR